MPEGSRVAETPARGRQPARALGVGLMGCGRFGRYVLEALAALPEVRLAALASRSEANLDAALAAWRRGRQAAAGPGAGSARPQRPPAPTAQGAEEAPRPYRDWQQLLSDPAVEVAVIAAPPCLHAAMARAALLAGKHVFLEKPGALAPEELEALGRLAAARGLAVGLDYVMRHNPIWRLVRAAVADGPLGAVERATVENHAHGDLPPDHWFWDPARSGGILVEHGVHFFDLFAWIAGPARRVQAAWLPDAAGARPAPDRVQATAVHGGDGPDAALVTYYHAFTRPAGLGRAWAHLACARGWAAVDGWTATRLEAVILADGPAAEEFFRARHPGADVAVEERFPGGQRAFGARRRSFRADRRLRVRVDLGDPDAVYRDCIRAGFRDLLRRAADPALPPAGASLADAARALRLAVAATAAADRGATLAL